MLVLLAAPKAGAALPPKPTLPAKAAVFVAAPDDAAGVKAEAALLKALEDASVPVVDVPAAFPTPAPDDGGAKLVAAAKQAYDDLDYEAAATKWTEALAWFTQHPEAATAKGLGEVHFFSAVLAIQNGGKTQAKKATEEFVRALLHDPELKADAQTYGADIKKAFDKALQELAARPTAPLSAESTPAGAEVTFRGAVVGTTPLSGGPAVPAGRHLVLFSRPGYAAAGALVDATKDGASAQATLTAAPGYAEVRSAAAAVVASGLGTKGKLPAGGKKVAELVKARFLVLSDGTAVEAWDVETGNRVTGLGLGEADLAKTAQKVKDFVSRPSPVGGDEKVAVAESGPRGPLLKQWWFWTAVGVVAVGTATTVGVVAANNSGGRPYNVVLGLP